MGGRLRPPMLSILNLAVVAVVGQGKMNRVIPLEVCV